MAALKLARKDPAEILDYPLDWGPELDEGDAIATLAWTFPAGITKLSETQTGNVSTVVISGGTNRTTYTLLCVITTTGGRTIKQRCKIRVQTR